MKVAAVKMWATGLAILICAEVVDAAAANPPRFRLFWTQRTDVGSPGPRFGHALAYDSDRGVTVLFGGEYSENLVNHQFFDDTWEYDGVSWKKITIDGPSPSARSRHAMCYDNLLRQVILFGGNDGDSFRGDVWNYESTGPQRGRWTHRIMALEPGGRAGHTMIFDYFEGRAIVAGGSPDIFVSQYRQTSEIWEWNNGTGQWLLRPESVGYSGGQNLGAGLTDHMMLYDYLRHKTAVVGGVGPFGSEIVANRRMFFISSTDPTSLCGSPTEHGAIVYDGFHDIYLQFGGTHYSGGDFNPRNGEPGLENIWHPGLQGFPCTFSPDDQIVTFLIYEPRQFSPGPRVKCAMVYDEQRHITMLFGGAGGTPETSYNDTWEVVTRDAQEIWVHFNYPGREVGTFELPYNTVAEGIATITVGGTLKIKTGSSAEALEITKPVTIEAVGGPVVIGQL